MELDYWITAPANIKLNGSGALSGKMLLVKIVENNKIINLGRLG